MKPAERHWLPGWAQPFEAQEKRRGDPESAGGSRETLRGPPALTVWAWLRLARVGEPDQLLKFL